MTSIVVKQNEPLQLHRLAAQRQLYSAAKKILVFQLVLSVPVAVFLAFLGLLIPALKGYVAVWGLLVIAIDLLLVAWQKRLQELAAKIQEEFDCDVLSLPWHELKVGEKPAAESVAEHAKKYSRWASSMPPLENWYPTSVQHLPLQWARIVCQRVNCWWDAKLRRRYAISVAVLLSFLAILMTSISIVTGMSMIDFFVQVVVPLSPTFKVGITHVKDQMSAASRLDKLKAHAEQLWKGALAGESVVKMTSGARALQDEIFDGRKRNPPVFDFLFKWLRSDQEAQMNYGADALIAEARKTIGH